jgi:hypothetical protein
MYTELHKFPRLVILIHRTTCILFLRFEVLHSPSLSCRLNQRTDFALALLTCLLQYLLVVGRGTSCSTCNL